MVLLALPARSRFVLLLLALAALSLPAQTVTPSVPKSFSGTDGANPNSLIQAADANFYGTTLYGGASMQDNSSCGSAACCVDSSNNNIGCGTIFEVTSPGNPPAVPHSFTGASLRGGVYDGSYPTGIIQGGDGNFYGTTMSGGTSLADNTSCQDQNDNPVPCCVDSNSNNIGCGTIFKIAANGSNYAVLYNFEGGQDGAFPNALIQGSDGNFYSTSLPCNANSCSGYGTVFQFVPSASGLGTLNALLPSFSDGASGAYPGPLIEGGKKNFYGTTVFGGGGSLNGPHGCVGFGCGALFQFTLSGASAGTLSDLCRLSQAIDPTANIRKGGTSGIDLRPDIVRSQPGRGFPTGGMNMPLYLPLNGLVEGQDSNFYGAIPPLNLVEQSVTPNADFASNDTVFQCSPSGSLTPFYAFPPNQSTGGLDGGMGQGTLLDVGSDGNYYGTALDTVFQITPTDFSNAPSTLTSPPTFYTLNGASEGSYPNALIQDNNGNFYGTAEQGGSSATACGGVGCGTVFELAISPASAAPVQLSLSSASTALTSSVTLSWKAVKAFSTTLQQCYAFVQGGAAGAGTWTGLQTGTIGNNGYSGSATVTPTQMGTYTYALTCGGVESGFTTLTVTAPPPLTFTPAPLPNATVNMTYSTTLTASGGIPPYKWNVTSGSLSPGLTLSANTGVISGTPTQIGVSSFTAQVQDSETPPATSSAGLSIDVAQPGPTVTLTASPNSGVTYGGTVTLTASETPVLGSSAGYSWSIYDGNTALISNAPSSSAGSYTMVTPALSVGQHTFTAVYSSTQNGNAAGTSNAVSLTVGKASTATALTASSASANLNGSVTFTAKVSTTASGTPTGSVQFMSGSTVLNTDTLSGGMATYTTTTLPAGTTSVTAVYSGDTNFSASTATAVQVVITAPGFSVSANPTSLSIADGSSGMSTITVTPVGGFNGTLNLSCSGLPAYSTCSFSQTSLSSNGSNTPVTTTLTISTDVSTAVGGLQTTQPAPPFYGSLPELAASSLAGFALMFGFRKRLSTARSLRGALYIVAIVALAGIVLVSGCGGGTPMQQTQSSVTPVGTSTVAVTASGGTGNTSMLNLTVTITQ